MGLYSGDILVPGGAARPLSFSSWDKVALYSYSRVHLEAC